MEQTSFLEGKKTYIMIIGAILTGLAQKYSWDLAGIDISAVSNDIMMLFLALAAMAKQDGSKREQVLKRTVQYQKAVIKREQTP